MYWKYILIAAGIIAALALAEWLRRRAMAANLKSLYQAAYVDKDEQVFLSLINSLQCKMYMSDASRSIMKLNFYVSQDNLSKVKTIQSHINPDRLSENDAVGYFMAIYGDVVERGEAKCAAELLGQMEKRFAKTQNPAAVFLLLDSHLAYDVYIKKDVARIDDLRELIASAPDDNARSVYQYRLAKLYYENNDHAACQKQLELALKNTASTQAAAKIKKILTGEWQRL